MGETDETGSWPTCLQRVVVALRKSSNGQGSPIPTDHPLPVPANSLRLRPAALAPGRMNIVRCRTFPTAIAPREARSCPSFAANGKGVPGCPKNRPAPLCPRGESTRPDAPLFRPGRRPAAPPLPKGRLPGGFPARPCPRTGPPCCGQWKGRAPGPQNRGCGSPRGGNRA